MPQRALSSLLVLVGFVLALALLVAGTDLVRAAGRGPRWKRRLLGAGLGVLAGLGLVSTATPKAVAAEEKAAVPAPAAKTAKQPSLADDPAWKRLMTVWKDAEDIYTWPGKKPGRPPFDETAKSQLLTRLEGLETDLKALAKAKLLSDAEVTLLDEGRMVMTNHIQDMIPEGVNMGTCYTVVAIASPMNPDYIKPVADRLAILEKLAADNTLNTEVLRLAKNNILREDLFKEQVLEYKGIFSPLQRAEREKAATIRKAARLSIKTLQLRADPPDSLAKAEPWTLMESSLKMADGFLAKPAPDDANEQWVVLIRLEWSRSDLVALQRVGLLHAAEAEFLLAYLSDLDQPVYQKGATEVLDPTRPPLPVKDALTPPGQQSLTHLKTRLPILEKLAAADTLHPEAAAMILGIVEADLKILDDKGAGDLKTDPEKQEAEKVKKATQAAVEKIRQKIQPAEMPVKEK
jgi:hypothetical protein